MVELCVAAWWSSRGIWWRVSTVRLWPQTALGTASTGVFLRRDLGGECGNVLISFRKIHDRLLNLYARRRGAVKCPQWVRPRSSIPTCCTLLSPTYFCVEVDPSFLVVWCNLCEPLIINKIHIIQNCIEAPSGARVGNKGAIWLLVWSFLRTKRFFFVNFFVMSKFGSTWLFCGQDFRFDLRSVEEILIGCWA